MTAHGPRRKARSGTASLALAAAGLMLSAIGAAAAPPADAVGDTYEIRSEYRTANRSGENSTGSSSGRDALIEHVVAIRDDGLELRYEMPPDSTEQDRAAAWRLPVRVLRLADGTFRLLDRAELESRVDPWLRAAGWTREICGKWIFTWNAFRIDCDPESALGIVEAFDLRPGTLAEGAPYADPLAGTPAPLRREVLGPDRLAFVASMAIDPETVRRAKAQTDVSVAEIMGESLTFDAALAQRAGADISGTVVVRFETDAAGRVWLRERTIEFETVTPDGTVETENSVETLARRCILLPG